MHRGSLFSPLLFSSLSFSLFPPLFFILFSFHFLFLFSHSGILVSFPFFFLFCPFPVFVTGFPSSFSFIAFSNLFFFSLSCCNWLLFSFSFSFFLPVFVTRSPLLHLFCVVNLLFVFLPHVVFCFVTSFTCWSLLSPAFLPLLLVFLSSSFIFLHLLFLFSLSCCIFLPFSRFPLFSSPF